MLHLFVRLTLFLAAVVLAVLLLAIVVKVVVLSALVAGLVLAVLFIVNLARCAVCGKSSVAPKPISNYPVRRV